MTEVEWLDIFGDNLREIMADKGYSQRELADATGLSEGAISYYLNKRCIPSIRAIINMAYELNVDLNDFIDFGDRIFD